MRMRVRELQTRHTGLYRAKISPARDSLSVVPPPTLALDLWLIEVRTCHTERRAVPTATTLWWARRTRARHFCRSSSKCNAKLTPSRSSHPAGQHRAASLLNGQRNAAHIAALRERSRHANNILSKSVDEVARMRIFQSTKIVLERCHFAQFK